jgi:DNA-binding NtrC family response regulator
VACALRSLRAMNTLTTTSAFSTALPAPRPVGYHGAVSDFKRHLIEATLHQVRGNRTHAARALGLQRTYLLRLIRELGVTVPAPQRRSRMDAVG